MDGVLLINKPIDYTSRDIVNVLSKKFSERKAGHTGTLDPFASGLMVLTFGKATKISSFLEATDKTYVAELTLGVSTDTLDLTGNIIETKDVIMPGIQELEKIFNSFLGEIEQIPPMYSAIKINGEELYKKARRGEVVERKARKIKIHSIRILSIVKNKILFEVSCSKGTYIRTLGKDIADKIGCGGHLSLLTRTSVGNFDLRMAKNLDNVCENDVISITKALEFLPTFTLNSALEKKARNGVKLFLENQKSERLFLKNINNEPIAIYELKEDGYYYSLRGLF